MLTGFIVFFGLSFLILAHEAGHFVAAKWFGLDVEEFGFGFPPRIFSWKSKLKKGRIPRQAQGETEYSLNWLPFGGFVKIAGENDRIHGDMSRFAHLSKAEQRRVFMFQPAWKRSIIILAGVFMNFVIGWWILSAVFMIGTPTHLFVTGVQSASPAEIVGFRAGDILKDFRTSEEFISYIDAHRGEPTSIVIHRDGNDTVLTVTPRRETKPGEGAIGVLLGESGVLRRSFGQAFVDGLLQAGILFWLTIVSFGDLLNNLLLHARVPEGVAGPIGIFSVAQETGRLGFVYLLQLLALISINLAVLNILPFPALDGGRFFFILIEKLKGSPLSVRVEGLINGLGFIVLVVLIIGITVHDIVQLF